MINKVVLTVLFLCCNFFPIAQPDRHLAITWESPVLLHEQIDPFIAATIEKAFLELHIEDPAALESVKAGWSEAKQAISYIQITDACYHSFRKNFGRRKDLQRILRQFINQE